jgi:hypothetical protein
MKKQNKKDVTFTTTTNADGNSFTYVDMKTLPIGGAISIPTCWTIDPSIYETKAKEVSLLVEEKQKAYGKAFNYSGEILKILYPNGVKQEQYEDLLTITRIIDKLFRVANKKEAFEESPWRDIMGYALLALTKEGK